MKNLAFGLCLLVLLAGVIGCGGGSSFWDSNFYIHNDTPMTLDIYMDGVFQFTLGPLSSDTILSVSPGEYLLQAFINPGNILYKGETVENLIDEDIDWHIT